MKIVPLVVYSNNQREIIGEARIDSDGNITGIIWCKKGHPILTSLLDSNRRYSFVQEYEPVKEKDNGVH